MAKACVKIYLGDTCIRTFGGSRKDIALYVANLKQATRKEIEDMYPQVLNGGEFRWSVICRKRRNKIYRFIELIDRLTSEQTMELIKLGLLNNYLLKLKYEKDSREIVFTSDGKINGDIEDSMLLLTGFVKRETVHLLGEYEVIKEILTKYRMVK